MHERVSELSMRTRILFLQRRFSTRLYSRPALVTSGHSRCWRMHLLKSQNCGSTHALGMHTQATSAHAPTTQHMLAAYRCKCRMHNWSQFWYQILF